MRILYEFSASLIQIQDIDELLWHVARQVVGQLGFEDCVIYLVDDDAQNLVQMAAIGDKNPTECEIRNRMEIPVGKGVTGRVARSGQPLLLDDTRTEADYIHD
ncbi:MAG: GAF domain-containing protein, partial [Pseudomonadota bacterium]